MKALELFPEPKKSDGIARAARLSPDRRYRYLLCRAWEATLPWAVFVGLNPSTADETDDDQTIRKCMGFARRWDCGGILMLNLFALRATLPSVLYEDDNEEAIVGPENDTTITNVLDEHDIRYVVACWGAHGALHDRGRTVADTIAKRRDVWSLGVTEAGEPLHPSRLAYNTLLRPFVLRGGSR